MKKYLLSVLLILIFQPIFAHTIDYVIEPDPQPFNYYIWEGIRHIIPLGLDHILFIMCIFFLNTSTKKVILQASMFTLAHSITLALVMFDIIDPPMKYVEALIALSIVFLAVENILIDKVKPTRIVLIFLFGLVHGMGFASVLKDLNLPKSDFIKALLGFNLGVEVAQIFLILILTLIVRQFRSNQVFYKKRIVLPVSIIIICIASYWTIERLFF